MTDFILSDIVLSVGPHRCPEDGLCAMEAVARLAGEPHSASPKCACPVLSAYVRSTNDFMPDDTRQALVQRLPALARSLSPEHEAARSGYLAWKAATVFVPIALRAANLPALAAQLEAQPINDPKTNTILHDVAAVAGAWAWTTASWAAEATAKAAAKAVMVVGTDKAAMHAGLAAAEAARETTGTQKLVWESALDILDGALAIGPCQQDTWSAS